MKLKIWLSPLTMAAGKLIRILLVAANLRMLHRLHLNHSILQEYLFGLKYPPIDHRLTGLETSLYVIDQGAGKLEIDPVLIRRGLNRLYENSNAGETGQRPHAVLKQLSLSASGFGGYIPFTLGDNERPAGQNRIFTIFGPTGHLGNGQRLGLGFFILTDIAQS